MAEDNFDIDKFMAERRKPASAQQPAAPSAGPSFDVDSFMQERKQPSRPQPRNLTPVERQDFNVRRPVSLDESLRQSAQANRGQVISRPQRRSPGGPNDPFEASLEEHAQRQRRKSEFEKKPITERFSERVYDASARSGGQLAKMGSNVIRAIGGAQVPGGEYALRKIDEFRAERDAELEAQKQARPPGGFLTETGENIIEAAGPAAVGGLLTAATGGGLPAAMAVGAGMGAAGADWQDPKRAVLQTAIGAVAPVVGGAIGRRAGGAVANRLSRPAAQGMARMAGEVGGGAAGNVLATGGEQLAFEGKLNPRELIKSGMVGGALSAPGAVGAARRPLSRPGRTEEIPTEPLTERIAPETAALTTQRLTYPDAPETQQMPAFRERLRAENAPTAEQPIVRPQAAPRQTREMPRIESEPTTALLPRNSGPTQDAVKPTVSPEMLAPEPAPGPPTERLQVPKATDETIQQLRSRQEELGRLAYDRRGSFTGDLRDEYNQITAHIRDYENARAPREIGEPPGQRPEALPNPAERGARREALQPRERQSGLLQASTPGRPVTQEFQLPPGPKKAETFISREDARQGHFERFNDQELVDEIRRLEDVRNQGIRGRSRLTPEQQEANRFDLKVATDMQKERRRLQQQIGLEPGERIAPRTPGRAAKTVQPPRVEAAPQLEAVPEGRKIQHTTLGEVTEAPSQKGVPRGKLRVIDAEGTERTIQNPRTRGNRNAAFAKAQEEAPKPEPQAELAQSVAAYLARKTDTEPPAKTGAINDVARKRLLDAAREQSDLSQKYYNKKASALPSAQDPIDGEIARLSAEFYRRAANGENVEALRDDIAAQAQKAAEDFNARQQQLHGKAMKKDWRSGIAGFMGPDSAASKINRHVYQMAKLIIEKAQPAPSAKTTGPAAQPAAPMESRSKPPDIARTMARIARTPTSPVEIAKLREQFPGMSKADFDAQVIKLNDEGRIALHRHDHPASLSDSQRNSMVKIGNDYFTAATIRERPGQVMGFGLGFLGNMRRPSRAEVSETAGGIQTVAQLGNPRFVIRNVLQHVAFGKQERTATRLAAAIDWAYSKASGKPRQITAPSGSDLASYVRNWGKAVRAYKAGQPLPGGSTPLQHTANANKVDRAINKAMTWMNEIPDAANWQTRFDDSLISIVEASKKSKSQLNVTDAIDQAMLEANRASLRDKNFVSSGLQYIKQGINKLSSPIFGTDKFGVGDFILKYAQTPGALFKRGLERSPLGLFQVAKEAATPGPFRRRNTLLALSRVAEGAATGVGLGAGLAAAGVLVGPEEESKTGRGFEREEGVRGYSLNSSALIRMLTGDFSGEMKEGDQLYSIDWLQPWAMNLSAGAALWGLHKNGKLGAVSGAKEAGEAVYNSLAKTLDVMGDQSVLKNLSKYLDRASGETFGEKTYSFMKAIGLDVPSSFVPSLARQTRQVIDPLERDTRPEQRGGVSGFATEAAGRALAQLPGVSSSFPTRPSLLTGEDRKTALAEFSTPARIGAQFSPANVSTYTPRPVAQEISRLNRAGENVSISFPAPKSDKRAGTREATSDLRVRERRFAETFSQMSKDLIADPFYKDADNETKAEAFNGLKRHLANLGKEDFEEKSVDEIIENAMDTVEKRRDKENQ